MSSHAKISVTKAFEILIDRGIRQIIESHDPELKQALILILEGRLCETDPINIPPQPPRRLSMRDLAILTAWQEAHTGRAVS